MLASKTYGQMFKMFSFFVFVLTIGTISADSVKRYVVFKDLLNDTVIDTSPSLPLDRYGDKYYYTGAIYEGNYYQALQFCNYHDMSLLSVETKEENDFLFGKLGAFLGAGEYHFWTSGTTMPDNHWVWLSTGKPIIYANWFPNQPDNAGNNEKCLEVRYSNVNKALMWNDHVCSIAKHVICEVKFTKSVSQLVSSISNCNLTLLNIPAV